MLSGLSPFFTIPDLSKDIRFKHLIYVKQSPSWRFYAGCPIRTARGVNIGTLCILDDKLRPGLTNEQQMFCDSIAQTVMRQLEMNRERDERRKATRMSRGLNAFVEGKNNLLEELDGGLSSDPKTTKATSPGSRALQTISSEDKNGIVPAAPTSVERDRPQKNPQANDTAEYDDEPEPPSRDAEAGKKRTLVRAVKYLRDSLDVEYHGGVVFLDTSVGFSSPDDYPNSSSGEEDNSSSKSESEPNKSNARTSFRSVSDLGHKKTEILAQAIPNNGPGESLTFHPLEEHFLQQILKRYPRGKMWSFDEEGGLSSSEEERRPSQGHRSADEHSQSKIDRRKAEAKTLQHSFPAVRQLLFIPLWDAASFRVFSGCFAWTTSSHQVFTREIELSFLIAFGNSICAEISRLEMAAADQQKGDFIGSISHELRSPLHGVLASAEFLAETECDSFQMGLISTIDSCGRTLLDTINHVLDFSKVNSFERTLRKVKRSKSGGHGSSAEPSLRIANGQGLLNIFATTDVAAVCEEVVEGVYMGQVYQDISSLDISDITAGNRGRTSEKGLAGSNRALMGGSSGRLRGKTVKIVLDIKEGDYTFTTQPGALRRVIMNLFSNSLKYTEKGTITVKLELRDLPGNQSVDDKPSGNLLCLTVTDTGKGIGSHYLKTRLYTREYDRFSYLRSQLTQASFCAGEQFGTRNRVINLEDLPRRESANYFSSLGLSIVRSITNMLGGSIDIQSELGRGTEVKVVIPLHKQSETETPISTPSSVTSTDRAHDNSIATLKARASGLSVALGGFDSHSPGDASITAVLGRYITSWYGLQIVDINDSSVDIIIVDEEEVSQLRSGNSRQDSSMIILCSSISRHGQAPVPNGGLRAVEYVSKPFGPYKLAKAIQMCLKTAESVREQLQTSPGLSKSVASSEPVTRALEIRATSLSSFEVDVHNTADISTTAIANDSTNARMAVTAPMSGAISAKAGIEASDFPFPELSAPKQASATSDENMSPWQESRRPSLRERKTDPTLLRRSWTDLETQPYPGDNNQDVSVSLPPTAAVPRAARILVVDDNKINLRLLKTFMAKRRYEDVEAAEDGKLAVQVFQQRQEGYNIIFMGKCCTYLSV